MYIRLFRVKYLKISMDHIFHLLTQKGHFGPHELAASDGVESIWIIKVTGLIKTNESEKSTKKSN